MAQADRPTERRQPVDYARMRRVLIEERQAKTLAHVRGSAGYAQDVSPHAHDAVTFRLINQRKELDKLPDADYVVPALDQWKHWSKMNDWDSRNRYLEGLIAKLRRRQASTGEIQALVTICRPTWVKIARRLREAGGDMLIDTQGDHQRQEAIRVQNLDNQEINQVMQYALLDTLIHCPTKFPRVFFSWLEEVLAYRALDHVRNELTENGSRLTFDGGIQTIVDSVLNNPDAYGAEYFRLPASPAHHQWLRTLDLPTIFALADEFATYARIRTACERAVDRLPKRQRQVIQHRYFEAMTYEQVGAQLGVAASTARNHKMAAVGNLERDDELYDVLVAVGKVRRYAREVELQRAA